MPHNPRVYIKRKPRYYVRICKGGVWYFLWQVRHDKKNHRMVPAWWEEAKAGETKPYLYKTLVGARNALDRFDVSFASKCDVRVWTDAILQT